jgi:hypothetical protein
MLTGLMLGNNIVSFAGLMPPADSFFVWVRQNTSHTSLYFIDIDCFMLLPPPTRYALFANRTRTMSICAFIVSTNQNRIVRRLMWGIVGFVLI